MGFEYDDKKKYDLLTAFEVFEHLVNPMKELEKILNLADTIIFSTVLLPSLLLSPDEWLYYGFNHGSIYLFMQKNLRIYGY